MAGKISEYPAKSTFDDTDLYDCSTTGTVSEKVTYSQIKDDLKNTFHTQGGNSYGADLIIGTNDTNDVVLEVNNVEAVRAEQTTKNLIVNNAIQAGTNTSNDAAQFDDIAFKCATLNPNNLFQASGGWQDFLLSLFDVDKIVGIEILIQGLDGRWYPPNVTFAANSYYEWRIDTASIEVRAEATETNLNLRPIKFFIKYTD